MTELEWAAVTSSFTEMFDVLIKVAPERIDGNKAFKAGTILNQELQRIRQKERIRQVFSGNYTNTNTNTTRQESIDDYNAKVEKKKQEIHDLDAANFMTLEQKLKASIERAEREKEK